MKKIRTFLISVLMIISPSLKAYDLGDIFINGLYVVGYTLELHALRHIGNRIWYRLHSDTESRRRWKKQINMEKAAAGAAIAPIMYDITQMPTGPISAAYDMHYKIALYGIALMIAAGCTDAAIGMYQEYQDNKHPQQIPVLNS